MVQPPRLPLWVTGTVCDGAPVDCALAIPVDNVRTATNQTIIRIEIDTGCYAILRNEQVRLRCSSAIECNIGKKCRPNSVR